MDKTSCKLTVFFENPFWVGVLECNEDGKLTVSKLTFYKEPKDYEIRNFILKKYNQLNFSPAVENVVIEKQKNYKKRQQVQLQGVGTKSQQALKLQHDQSKSEHILQNKKQKELDKMRLFALKQQKKKEKHKGH